MVGGQVVSSDSEPAEGGAAVTLVVLPNDAPHSGSDGHPDAALNARIADPLVALLGELLHR